MILKKCLESKKKKFILFYLFDDQDQKSFFIG